MSPILLCLASCRMYTGISLAICKAQFSVGVEQQMDGGYLRTLCLKVSKVGRRKNFKFDRFEKVFGKFFDMFSYDL